MIMYKIVFEDKYNKCRYLSANIYTLEEIRELGIDAVKAKEYIEKYPDSKFLDESYLKSELQQVQDIGVVPIKVQENY